MTESNVVERLNRLERKVSRYRWLLGVLALALVGVIALGQIRLPPKQGGGILPVVRARKMLIYNEKNEIVYLVGSERGTGKGTWQLIHKKKPVASCFPGKWGGSIQLSQQGGEKTGLLLVGDRNGLGSAVIWDKSKNMKWQAP